MLKIKSKFDGETYDPALDKDRLEKQLGRVYAFMSNGGWWTIRALQMSVGGTEAGISARIRDLRKEKFGGYIINRRRIGDYNQGCFQYQLERK